MTIQPFEIDSSRMPVKLGSALRVPSYAFPNWGITGDEAWLRKESDRQYEIEWKGGSKNQMAYVVSAITNSGLGNYSQMLRDENAGIVSLLAQRSPRRLRYLELGAGVSTVNLYQRLLQDGVDIEKINATLVEPSKDRLMSVAEKLRALGAKNLEFIIARDIDIPYFVEPNSQDVASYVAVLHHHAYLDTPLAVVRDSLRDGGMLVIADWHNAMWEHPNRVYDFLEREFDWPTKQEDLAVFSSTYPKALEKAPELTPLNAASNSHIKKFWKSWSEVRAREIREGAFRPEDDIWMLEAHRPVERQLETLEALGYRLQTRKISDLQDSNPRSLVEGAGILNVTLAQK